MDYVPCTIQQLPPLDTLLMCAIGGLVALLIVLTGLGLFALAQKVRRGIRV